MSNPLTDDLDNTNEVFRLRSPFGQASKEVNATRRIQCDIPLKVYLKFFQGTLQAAGRGVQYNVITSLLAPLIQKCHELGIPTEYDPDNDERVARVLANLNFDNVVQVESDAFHEGFTAGYAAARDEIESKCPEDPLARGTDSEPDRSESGRDVAGDVTRIRQSSTDNDSVAADLSSRAS